MDNIAVLKNDVKVFTSFIVAPLELNFNRFQKFKPDLQMAVHNSDGNKSNRYAKVEDQNAIKVQYTKYMNIFSDYQF